MNRIRRQDIVDYQTYSERRDVVRQSAQAAKSVRRVHVGEHLTFLFENVETMRYQVQEMMRAERIVREQDIQHEIDTYNELLGGPGELGCTLLVEIEDAADRDVKLRAWLTLPESLYAKLEDGSKVRAKVDERQRSLGRLSSVQYLKFETAGRVPVAIGVDHPELNGETVLSPETRAALRADLDA